MRPRITGVLSQLGLAIVLIAAGLTDDVRADDSPPPGATNERIRALVITGGHDHETSFYSLFEGHDDLSRVPVSTSALAFAQDLSGKYDVIVMYDFSRELGETGRKNLRAFVEQGGGVVVLHHALLDYQDWDWWTREAVGGSYRLRGEGDQPSSTYKAGRQFTATPVGEHPIARGLKPFQVVDEVYRRMRFAPGIVPLLTTDQPDSDRTLAWIGPNPKQRVVAIQLGHGPEIFSNPSYRDLVHRAIRWASGRLK